MARRKQSSIEDLVEIVSFLPWWVGASLAPLSYLLLHPYSLRELPNASNLKDLGDIATGSLLHVLALFGQYALPLIFGFGAAISAYKKYSRQKLHDKVTANPMKDVLNDMSWHQFEMLVGEAYRQQGYQIKELGGSGPDGGADLVITKDNTKYLVQCKQWQAYKVGVKPVRELLGVMVGQGATGGIVVTSGDFTADAINFARNNNIQLVDGHTLHEMTRGLVHQDVPSDKPSPSSVFCQKCGSPMALRTAKKGPSAGHKFWGCTKYPTCRFTMAVEE